MLRLKVDSKPLRKSLQRKSQLVVHNTNVGLQRAAAALKRDFGSRKLSKNLDRFFRWKANPNPRSIDDVEVVLDTTSEVAHDREFGKKIKAPAGGSLPVPIGGALDARGRVKKEYEDYPRRYRQLKARRRVEVIPSRNGSIVYERVGRRLVPIYVLRKTITIKPTLGFRKAVKRFATRGGVRTRAREGLNDALRGRRQRGFRG